MRHAAGNPVRRLRLLQLMGLNPNRHGTRELITNASKYTLIVGSHSGNELRLADKGRLAVDPATPPRQRRQTVFELAINDIEPLKLLYDTYSGKTMPSLEVMQDELEDLDPGDRKPCVDIFVGNANYVGLLSTIGGARHLLSIDDALDELAQSETPGSMHGIVRAEQHNNDKAAADDSIDFERICFFIAPIGDKKSEDPLVKQQRRHSDTILNQYVQRALDEQNLRVVRRRDR